MPVRAARLERGPDGTDQARARPPSRLEADQERRRGKAASLMQCVGLEDAVDAVPRLDGERSEQIAHLGARRRVGWILEDDRDRDPRGPRPSSPLADAALAA